MSFRGFHCLPAFGQERGDRLVVLGQEEVCQMPPQVVVECFSVGASEAPFPGSLVMRADDFPVARVGAGFQFPPALHLLREIFDFLMMTSSFLTSNAISAKIMRE